MRAGPRGRAALLALGLATAPVGARAGEVAVRYVAPERFTDAENRIGTGLTLRVTLGEMTRIFQEAGRRFLPPGDSLDVTIRDIDLAGFERPGLGGPTALRVVEDASPPRIRLAYVLRRAGRAVAQDAEDLTDINFLLRPGVRFATGPLSHERALVEDWFRRRFAR